MSARYGLINKDKAYYEIDDRETCEAFKLVLECAFRERLAQSNIRAAIHNSNMQNI